jgi:hypothetical protein
VEGEEGGDERGDDDDDDDEVHDTNVSVLRV